MKGQRALIFLDVSVKQGASIKLISHFLTSQLLKFPMPAFSPGVAVASARNDQMAGSCTRSTSRLVIEIPQVGEMELLPIYHHVFMIVYLSFNKLQ